MAKKSGKKRPRGGGRPSNAAPAKKPERRRNPAKPTRDQRLAAARLARRRKDRLVRISVTALIVLVVGGLVTWRVLSWRNDQQTIAALTAGACRYDTESDPGRVNEHSSGATFRLNPPSGGVHPSTPASAGIYTAETSPADGEVVHALEHGLIAVFYRPDLAEGAVSALGGIARANSRDVLLLPRPSLQEPVAATAWHRRLLCDEVEVASVRRFVEAYVGKGPERVPRN